MKRILIVDDAATMRLYHRSILESSSFAVDEAWNGMEALERALGNAYDAFLVDVNMPGMDGYSFLRELRQQPIAHVPAIIISPEPSETSKALACESGANAFLPKPVAPERLLSYVTLMVGKAAR